MRLMIDEVRWKIYKLLLHIRPTILIDLLKRILPIHRIIVETREGRFWIDPISNMGLGIKEDIFEVETRTLIKQHLMVGNIFIDVGANEGFYSMIAAKKVSSTGRIIAIEPQQRLISVLEKNQTLNNLENITIVNAAVSDGKTSELEIYLSPSTNTGSSSITRRYFVARKQKVVSKTLEAIFSECNIATAHFVKIDVEGFEPEVIYGAEKLLADHRIHHLFVDFHHSILQERGINPETLHNFITSFDYNLVNEPFQPSGYNLYISK